MPRTNAAPVHSISTEIRTETAPHGAIVLEFAGQTSNEAALRAARDAEAAPGVLPTVDTAVLHRAHQLDDNAVPVRDVRSAFLSAGPEMAGSLLPAIVNLLDADGAVSPFRAAVPAEEPHSGLTR